MTVRHILERLHGRSADLHRLVRDWTSGLGWAARAQAPTAFDNSCEPLYHGARGLRVLNLQLALNRCREAGDARVPCSARLDARTRQALETFQRRNQLAVTGAAGWPTLRALQNRAGLGPLAGLLLPQRPRPCGVVLAPLRAVYLDIPKVASTSLKHALIALLNLPPHHLGVHFRPDVPLAHWADLQRGVYRGWLKFAFVRNPWDRLVSCYKSKLDLDDGTHLRAKQRFLSRYPGRLRPDMSFADFARFVCECPDAEANPHFRSQHCFLQAAPGAVDYLGRFESLAADWQEVCRRLGRSVALPRLNAHPRPPLKRYYSRELADRVGRRYARDAALFGYSFSA